MWYGIVQENTIATLPELFFKHESEKKHSVHERLMSHNFTTKICQRDQTVTIRAIWSYKRGDSSISAKRHANVRQRILDVQDTCGEIGAERRNDQHWLLDISVIRSHGSISAMRNALLPPLRRRNWNCYDVATFLSSLLSLESDRSTDPRGTSKRDPPHRIDDVTQAECVYVRIPT